MKNTLETTTPGIKYPVRSSRIYGLIYYPDILTLRVTFKNQRIYAYFPVDRAIVNKLVKAESVGKEFEKLIKKDPNIGYSELFN